MNLCILVQYLSKNIAIRIEFNGIINLMLMGDIKKPTTVINLKNMFFFVMKYIKKSDNGIRMKIKLVLILNISFLVNLLIVT